MKPWRALWGSLALACSVGEGTGEVTSERLFVDQCWLGPFSLNPTFFAANPHEDTLSIRVQRGEQPVLESDGFSMLVHGVANIRSRELGERLSLGLPPGVSPPGFPPVDVLDAPATNLTLYLNSSCRGQNSALTAVDGWVQFERLFSGDTNEDDVEDRLTEGSFSATVVDPRDAVGRDEDGSIVYDPDKASRVDGQFSFVFHRGTPAQPFP